jgi:hypothetical protein
VALPVASSAVRRLSFGRYSRSSLGSPIRSISARLVEATVCVDVAFSSNFLPGIRNPLSLRPSAALVRAVQDAWDMHLLFISILGIGIGFRRQRFFDLSSDGTFGLGVVLL